MNSNKKIALNTAATYSRTIVAIFFVLFSSRWVLEELGTSDFGIFNLVGSILVFITFFNNVLSVADARFFAIELGKEREGKMNDIFKSSFILHVILPPICVIIGGIIGYYAITCWLVIPSDRIEASLLVFVYSLFAIFFSMVSVPYRALFIAHQNIVESTILELLQTLLYFLSAFSLRFIECDKLVSYSILYSSSQILICLLFIGYAMKKYPCTRNLKKANSNRKLMNEMLKFSFWSALGDIGHLMRTQGIAIIVNLLYSTPGNAALGIANQVSAQASGLSNSLMRSTSPEIYRLVGNQNIVRGQELAAFVNKIAVLLMIVLGLPLMVNMDAILDLWLVEVPPFTNNLCVCFIIMFIIERFTMGHYIYMAAINEISKIQIVVFITYSLCLVFPFIGLCDNFGITGIGLSCIISMILGRLYIGWMYNRRTNNNIKKEMEFITRSSLFVFLSYLALENIVQPHEWLSVIVYCLIIVAIVIPTFMIITFSREDINRITLLLKRNK